MKEKKLAKRSTFDVEFKILKAYKEPFTMCVEEGKAKMDLSFHLI